MALGVQELPVSEMVLSSDPLWDHGMILASPLASSIRRVGVQHPLLVLSSRKELKQVLDGQRRKIIAEHLGISHLPARLMIEEESRPEEILLETLRSQLGSREPNLIEKATTLRRAYVIGGSTAIVNQVREWLQIEALHEGDYQKLLELPLLLQKILVERSFSIKDARLLFCFHPIIWPRLAEWWSQLKCSKSELRRLMVLCLDAAKTTGLSHEALLDQLVARGQRFDEIQDILLSFTSPRLWQQRMAVAEKIGSRVGRKVNLIPPRDTESEDFELRVSFRDLEELEVRLSKLTGA